MSQDTGPAAAPQQGDAAAPAVLLSPLLAIDLDGTLSRTDTLWESILGYLAQAPFAAFAMLLALPRGRAGFKRWLAQRYLPDPASLIYDSAVIRLAEAARAQGQRVILVTGADQAIADRVAAHCQIFDGAHGSNGTINLTSHNKAAWLTAQAGRAGFAYAGDSRADLAVWQAARRGYAVRTGSALLARARQVQPDMVELAARDRPAERVRLMLRALRPHQWAKNALIFVPALAGHHFDLPTLAACTAAFLAFSLLASSVYVLNDLLDLPHDRAHPRKINRPFASGRLKLSTGPALIGACLAGTLALALFLPARFALVLGIYYATTTAYSLRLKRLMMWDVVTLAGLYTVRIFAGAAAVQDGFVSPWLGAFSLFLFFCLAVVKRQAELHAHAARGGDGALSGRAYRPGDLPMLSAMAASCGYIAVLVLALYMNSAEVVALYRHPKLLWALCPIVLFWVSRVLMLSQRGEMHDDPVVFALRDRVSLACGAAALAAIAAGI